MEENNVTATRKPAILLQHGLETDMMQWVFNDPSVAPAFVLARSGYDVWLGNNRGTRWSESHVSLSNKDKAFWDWTWEEMGTKDTPAVINHILNATGNTKISYMGHSEGTTQLMAGAALLPDYYKKVINVSVLLAPTSSVKSNNIGILNLMSWGLNRSIITSLVETIHMYSLLPNNFLNSGVATAVCKLFNGSLCNAIMGIVSDVDPKIDNTERYDVYTSNLPAGAGYKNIIHYG